MNTVASLVALILLGFIFYGPWQTHWEDWARQRLFEVRDRVFDMAADGHISFSDRRYVTIRRSINTMIRFAHQVTWVRLIYFALTAKGGVEALRAPSGLELALDSIREQFLRVTRAAGRVHARRCIGYWDGRNYEIAISSSSADMCCTTLNPEDICQPFSALVNGRFPVGPA